MGVPLKTCAILPAYNAAETIGPLVTRVKRLGLDAVVINDGSSDRTVEAASDAGATVISHLSNHGKGVALRTGFAYALQAGYDVVVTMDSDGQHDPEDIPRLLDATRHTRTPIVIGHRLVDRERMPRLRRWTNRLMSELVSWVARQRIPDSQCGLRVIGREALQTLQLRSRQFDLETEVLLVAAARRWDIVSVPIRTIYRGHRSHIRPVRDGVRFLSLILRYALARPSAFRRGPLRQPRVGCVPEPPRADACAPRSDGL